MAFYLHISIKELIRRLSDFWLLSGCTLVEMSNPYIKTFNCVFIIEC